MHDPKVDSLINLKSFVKELFQIVEWAIVVAAIQVAGEKLSLPIAIFAGWTLFIVLSFYVGVRIYDLTMWARFREGPRTHDISGLMFSSVVSLTFGTGLTMLIQALNRISLGG